jgi:AmiR/NasT family two-component response regulator
MARSTKTQKALNLNAAHGLLSQRSGMAEAATILARERGISMRQAYRYLQGAGALGRAMPVGEPSVPRRSKFLATCSHN